MANKTHFVSGSAGSLSHVPPHKKQRQSSTKTTNVLAAPTNHGQLTPSTHMQFKFTQESKTGFDKNHIFTSKSFDLYRLLYIVICPLYKTTSQFKSKPLHWIKPQIKPNNLTKMPHELCINLKHMQMRRLLLNPQITIISNLPSAIPNPTKSTPLLKYVRTKLTDESPLQGFKTQSRPSNLTPK